jgi:ribonuclease P protein component
LGAAFPQRIRLTRRQQFLKVQQEGAKVAVDPLLALALRNGLSQTRMGFTVSSKVGNAVVRNRIRRRLRELYRHRRSALPPGLDVVLVARSAAATAEMPKLAAAFDQIAARLRSAFP